jgi:hypothetical protein
MPESSAEEPMPEPGTPEEEPGSSPGPDSPSGQDTDPAKTDETEKEPRTLSEDTEMALPSYSYPSEEPSLPEVSEEEEPVVTPPLRQAAQSLLDPTVDSDSQPASNLVIWLTIMGSLALAGGLMLSRRRLPAALIS